MHKQCYRALFEVIFLKFYDFYKNSIVMGKKDRCAVFGCNNDRRFPDKYVVKDHTSFFGGKPEVRFWSCKDQTT